MEKVIEKEIKTQNGECQKESKKDDEKKWEKPTLKDVSKEVMAQPYIRFT
ncbi:MAG: hypothetical protein HY762_06035 [Planctomycetes bacterium]|nr:hypothetical protein [Planctomycetota bacterium]